MANDVYNTVSKCMSCTRNRQTNKKRRKLRPFPPAGLLDFIAIEILGSLPKTEGGTNYIVVITVHYSMLIKAIPTAKTTATGIGNNFMEHWVANFGIPFTVMTDNEPQFSS